MKAQFTATDAGTGLLATLINAKPISFDLPLVLPTADGIVGQLIEPLIEQQVIGKESAGVLYVGPDAATGKVEIKLTYTDNIPYLPASGTVFDLSEAVSSWVYAIIEQVAPSGETITGTVSLTN